LVFFFKEPHNVNLFNHHHAGNAMKMHLKRPDLLDTNLLQALQKKYLSGLMAKKLKRADPGNTNCTCDARAA
jgi:hypothetical protein